MLCVNIINVSVEEAISEMESPSVRVSCYLLFKMRTTRFIEITKCSFSMLELSLLEQIPSLVE